MEENRTASILLGLSVNEQGSNQNFFSVAFENSTFNLALQSEFESSTVSPGKKKPSNIEMLASDTGQAPSSSSSSAEPFSKGINIVDQLRYKVRLEAAQSLLMEKYETVSQASTSTSSQQQVRTSMELNKLVVINFLRYKDKKRKNDSENDAQIIENDEEDGDADNGEDDEHAKLFLDLSKNDSHDAKDANWSVIQKYDRLLYRILIQLIKHK